MFSVDVYRFVLISVSSVGVPSFGMSGRGSVQLRSVVEIIVASCPLGGQLALMGDVWRVTICHLRSVHVFRTHSEICMNDVREMLCQRRLGKVSLSGFERKFEGIIYHVYIHMLNLGEMIVLLVNVCCYGRLIGVRAGIFLVSFWARS